MPGSILDCGEALLSRFCRLARLRMPRQEPACGSKHAIQVVSECGHNDRCIFTTDDVLRVIFPKI